MFKKLTFILFFVFACFFISSVFALDKVDINNASLSQLDIIINVGPKTAQKIIDARPFSSVNDLAKVKGIGNGKTLQEIISQGVACINCETTLSATETPDNVVIPVEAEIQNPVPTPAPVIVYPSGVFINEILPNPEGADETEEWIELYNSNNFDVDLSNWKIKDTTGTVSTFTIPNDSIILAGVPAVSGSFLVFKRPETKIMLNNDEDGLNLYWPNGKIVDTVSYTKAPLGQSYSKITGSWVWSTTLTAGFKNIVPSPKLSQTLSNTNNSVKNDGVALQLADLSQNTNINQDNKIINPWFLFIIVLVTTIFLATLVLLIKLRLGKENI